MRGMILSANISQTTHHSIHNLPGHWRVGTHVKTIQPCDGGSLVPRLSPCANEKPKERGEPSIIYHMRNAMGRETLIRCGRVNELAHTLLTELSSESFLADRTELYGTTLHYLAVQQAMMSVHRLVYSKISLTLPAYLVNRLQYTLENGFKALLNTKVTLS